MSSPRSMIIFFTLVLTVFFISSLDVHAARTGGHAGGGYQSGGRGYHGGYHSGGYRPGGYHSYHGYHGGYRGPYYGWLGVGVWPYPYVYPYPYYYPYQGGPYSYPYVYESSPGAVYDAQPVIPNEPQQSYWYYCKDSQGYYPYVQSCPGGWTQVIPTPAETE